MKVLLNNFHFNGLTQEFHLHSFKLENYST